MRLLFLIFVSFSLLVGCKSSNSVAKQELILKQFSELETLINNKNYTIEITAVFPFNTNGTTQVLNSILLQTGGNNANRIDVNKEGYYIKVINDSTKADLPFFGERRIVSNYGGNDSGILFDASLKNYSLNKNLKKKTLNINFDVSNNTESYAVYITAYPNKIVNITINSSHTANISYLGILTTGTVN